MEVVELGPLSLREWVALTGHERRAFGSASAELVFRPKDRHVGIRADDGRLLGAAGLTVATVEVEGHPPFHVVGLGALIVHESVRGTGLGRLLMDRLKALAESTGVERAMLFCDEELAPRYLERGYEPIRSPVFVEQPGGTIEMPMPAFWRPLRPAGWPPGVVRVHGLPF